MPIKRSGTLLMLCALLAVTVVAAPAVAQTEEPTDGAGTPEPPAAEYCSEAFRITRTLRLGTEWNMCWREDARTGIILEKISVKSPRDDLHRLVVEQITPVQMFVPYDTGTVAFDDIIQYSYGGNNLKRLNQNDCPVHDDTMVFSRVWGNEGEYQAILCAGETARRGTAYRSQWNTDGAILNERGSSLVVASVSAIANYEYRNEYVFRDDGAIEVGAGATGELYNNWPTDPELGWPIHQYPDGTWAFNANHYHSAVWRVHMGVDGASDQKVVVSDSTYDGTRGTNNVAGYVGRTTTQSVDSGSFIDNDLRRRIRFVADGITNTDGLETSYEFEFQKADSYGDDNYRLNPCPNELVVSRSLAASLGLEPEVPEGDDDCIELDSHLQHEVAVTQYDPTHLFPAQRRGDSQATYMEPETLIGFMEDSPTLTDPTAWVNVGHHHLVRNEDSSPMPMHWQTFSIVPRDFWGMSPITDPARADNPRPFPPEWTPPDDDDDDNGDDDNGDDDNGDDGDNGGDDNGDNGDDDNGDNGSSPASICDAAQGGATFPDSVGSGHSYFIDCLAELGIVTGLSDGTYNPTGQVTRAQLASFVVRALERGGTTLSVGDASFTDVAPTSTHGQAILKLAEAGIIQGYEDGTFRPGAQVTREQTARYIVGAIELALGAEMERSGASFPDVGAGSEFASDIDALATAGIISGFSDGTFGVGVSVTRGQMARFIGNAIELLNEEGAYELT